jgi:leucyl/phenylalanyl-tRNA--protein transferase
MVLFVDELRVSRSFRRAAAKRRFEIRVDTAFDAVITACAAPRSGHRGTWITGEMVDAYVRLHRLGHAHSVEAWEGDKLAGGLYGVSIGRMFFGESMFARETDASRLLVIWSPCSSGTTCRSSTASRTPPSGAPWRAPYRAMCLPMP